MPKKQPKNAFFFFMMDFKEEQRKKGINYGNWQEVSLAAGPLWKDASQAVRSKYDAKAKQEKEKRNIPAEKYTSTGIPLSQIEQMEQDKLDAEATERQEIKNFVILKGFSNNLLDEDIFLIDVNYYCKVSGEYLIGEMTLLRFSLRDGIKEHYHEVINPGYIPVGYAYDVKLGCEDYGLEMPDEGTRKTDYIHTLSNIMDYLKQKDRTVKTLPPLYTMPDKVEAVVDFIQQVCSKAAEDDRLFRVYKLNTLFFYMINEVKTDEHGGFPKESLALTQLKTDRFKYTPRIACEMHEENEKSVECSLSRVTRWCYSILDLCCSHADLPLVPGKHMPMDYDLDAITAIKEQRRAQGASAATSLNSSFATDSFNDSIPNSSFTTVENKKKKRTNAPLRMPKADYSQNIQLPPELSEMMEPLAIGRGRGRPKY